MIFYNRDIFMATILVSFVSPAFVTASSSEEDESEENESSFQYNDYYLEDPGNISGYNICYERMEEVCGKRNPEAIDFARVAMRDWKRGDTNTIIGQFLGDYYEKFRNFLDPESVDCVDKWCEKNEDKDEGEDEDENEDKDEYTYTYEVGEGSSTVLTNTGDTNQDTAGTSSKEYKLTRCQMNSRQSLHLAFYHTTLQEFKNEWDDEDLESLGLPPNSRNYRYEYMEYLIESFSLTTSMNSYIAPMTYSLHQCVMHVITNLVISDFGINGFYAKYYCRHFKDVVSLDIMRVPSQFCQDEYQDNDAERENCIARLNNAFQIQGNTSKKIIFNKALFDHKQLSAENDDNNNNPDIHDSVHPVNSFVYKYLTHIAESIGNSDILLKDPDTEESLLMYQSPFLFCCWLYNKPIYEQLTINKP